MRPKLIIEYCSIIKEKGKSNRRDDIKLETKKRKERAPQFGLRAASKGLKAECLTGIGKPAYGSR